MKRGKRGGNDAPFFRKNVEGKGKKKGGALGQRTKKKLFIKPKRGEDTDLMKGGG